MLQIQASLLSHVVLISCEHGDDFARTIRPMSCGYECTCMWAGTDFSASFFLFYTMLHDASTVHLVKIADRDTG